MKKIKAFNKKEYLKEYYARPEVKEHRKEHMKEYYARPEVKEHMKEYYARPEVKEHMKEYKKEYCARPEVKEHRKEHMKEYYARPEVKARRVPSWMPNDKSTEKALENARKFLSEETAKAFVFDGVLLEKRWKAFNVKPTNLDERGMIT